MECNSCSSGF